VQTQGALLPVRVGGGAWRRAGTHPQPLPGERRTEGSA